MNDMLKEIRKRLSSIPLNLKNNFRRSALDILLFCGLCLIVTAIIVGLMLACGEKSSKIADVASILAAAFSGIAALIMSLTIFVQLESNRLNDLSHKRERFETNFFNLIGSLRKQTEMTCISLNGRTFTGLRAYIELYLCICDFSRWDPDKIFYNEIRAPGKSEGTEHYHDFRVPGFKEIKDNTGSSEKPRIAQIQKRYDELKKKTDIRFALTPLFYKFMKVLEYVIREKELLDGKQKCLYISILLDELINAQTGLLLLYFLCEESNEREDIKFFRTEEYGNIFADCNLFRYLVIDDNWAAYLGREGIDARSFVHPSVNPDIAFSLYEKQSRIIHTEDEWKCYETPNGHLRYKAIVKARTALEGKDNN